MKKFIRCKAVCLSFLAALLLIGLSFVNNSFAQIPVYRFYNDALKTHLYTTDENEKVHLEADSGWRYEGVAWNALATQEAGTLPVYRFYCAVTTSHLYTMDENEKAVLMSGTIFRYEGVAYYAYPGPSGNAATPIYRLYSELLRRHLFTTDANEAIVLDAGPNWRGEGIAWYVGGGYVIPPGPTVCSGGTLYDDYSGTTLSADKWGREPWGRHPGTQIRGIENGKLVMELGGRSGPLNSLDNQLRFNNPNAINAIEAKVNVKSSQCSVTNQHDGGVSANIDGFWYQSADGPIWAGILLEDQGDGQLNAFYRWTSREGGEGGMAMDNGTLVVFNYDTEYTMKIEYDGNNSFTFSIDSYNATLIGPARTGASGEEWKGLNTSVNAWNDTNSVNGSISATFDDVIINNSGTYYDQFGTALLDPTKWRTGRENPLEIIRKTSSGQLNLHVRAIDARNTVAAGMPLMSYVETKMMVKSDSQLYAGAVGAARLSGDYYNENHGSGSGLDYNEMEGNVFVSVRIQMNDDRSLVARADVLRSDDAFWSTETELFKEYFQTPINFDTFYTFSIQFTGTKLIFKCNDETLRYTITTPTYPSFFSANYLQSRVWADAGESGYMKAAFDYVCAQ